MGKIVLITGASSGIGKETAISLSESGYKVYAASRRVDKMLDLQSAGIELVQLDVTNQIQVEEVVSKIVTLEGRIDVLINNAGFGQYGALEDVPVADARYQYEVNVLAVARLIQLVLPHMREQKFGKIINISSVAGKVVAPYGGWYHSSKFALEALSDALRLEVKQFGIDVVVIEPGVIKTEFGNHAKENLLKFSGNSVYAQGAKATGVAFDKMFNNGHDPVVITRLVFKAIESRKPKTRYHAGYMAGLSLFARKIFSDKIFDKIIQMQFEKGVF